MKKMNTQLQTPTKKKINGAKEPNNAHKNILKEEILQIATENFMEMLLDKVNQMYKMHSRNYKAPKIKNTRRHSEEPK
jgi:hypothetical protein